MSNATPFCVHCLKEEEEDEDDDDEENEEESGEGEGKSSNTNTTNTTSEVRKLMKCGGCKVVWYCDKMCQKLHWKWHKEQCSSLALRPPRPCLSVPVFSTPHGAHLLHRIVFQSHQITRVRAKKRMKERLMKRSLGKLQEMRGGGGGGGGRSQHEDDDGGKEGEMEIGVLEEDDRRRCDWRYMLKPNHIWPCGDGMWNGVRLTSPQISQGESTLEEKRG